jgi:dTDP-4-dehydrorhamnose 3,5-epimerase-like enzyme
MPLSECKLLDFPKITDPRGNLTFIEGSDHIPFEIKRVYYLYDVPGGSLRGGHAHKALEQIIIALSGSFDVLLDDGGKKEIYRLNSPSKGLLVTPMVWRELNNFSSGSVCLVLASEHFSEEDYYRDYSQFLKDR